MRSPSFQYPVHCIEYNSCEYQSALQLRHRVFFAPHGIVIAQLSNPAEQHDQHFAILKPKGRSAIAYSRLAQVNELTFQIYQMVVSPKYQRQGLGSKLLLAMIEQSLQRSAETIILNARVGKEEFYRKHGFEISSEVFESKLTGVSHIQMRREIF